MKTADVLKLPPLDRFLYWIRERHNIYLKRRLGRKKPWTNDEVLQNFFFTNPYRENDRVTVWFRDNIREPMRDDPAVLLATVIFRWFNLPETGGQLVYADLLRNWDEARALALLRPIRDAGGQIFTGAFMINSPGGRPKLEAICERISNVWRARERLLSAFDRGARSTPLSMERAHGLLTEFPGLGGFMAYEIVCDLRYTFLLENAPDKRTWCNPGPGCIRGLYRLAEEPFKKGDNASSPPRPKDWQRRMADLLVLTEGRLTGMPQFEMREIEHSCCEWDKYERALANDGRMKRTYRGV